MHICEECGKQISTFGNLTKHLKNVHKIERINFVCECGEEFSNAQSLNAHFRWCLIHRHGKEISAPHNKGKPSPHKGKTYSEYLQNPDGTKEKLIAAHARRSTTDNNLKKQYYKNCAFDLSANIHRVKGYELLKKYGMYSKTKNPNGVVRDHRFSIYERVQEINR